MIPTPCTVAGSIISATYLCSGITRFPRKAAIARLFCGVPDGNGQCCIARNGDILTSIRPVDTGWISVPDNTLSMSHRYDVLFSPAMTPRCLILLSGWRTVCLLAFGAILHHVLDKLLPLTTSTIFNLVDILAV